MGGGIFFLQRKSFFLLSEREVKFNMVMIRKFLKKYVHLHVFLIPFISLNSIPPSYFPTLDQVYFRQNNWLRLFSGRGIFDQNGNLMLIYYLENFDQF